MIVLRAGSLSVRTERRYVLVAVALTVLVAALALLGLCQGDEWRTPYEVMQALAGYGDWFVVQQWRLPRVVAAIVFGAALAMCGAVFQTVTRNALGSPDIIGLNAGAYTGALLALIALNGTAAAMTSAAMIGALATAATMYILALRSGFDTGRMLIIGVALNAILSAFNSWTVLRADLDVAMVASAWNAGSLNGLDWSELVLPFSLIAIVMVVLGVLAVDLRQSSLGDAVAIATGVRLTPLRLGVVIAAACGTATVTAATGPITFIALAAPQIGRRLARSPGVPLLPAALTGAALLLAADVIAQRLLSPNGLPVGAVTTAIGGCYLLWLLRTEIRR